MEIRRLLIVGWDSADPTRVGRLLGEGRLPNLARLRERGVAGPIRTTVPDTSLAAWTSAMTGHRPGRHGMVNFVRRVSGAYRLQLVDASDRLVPTLSSMAGQAGLRVASLGVPGTFPPEATNGVCISGFDSPVAAQATAKAFHPRALYDELSDLGLSWPYGGLDELAVGPGWHQRAFGLLLEGIERKTAIAEALLSRASYDLFTIVFGESDTVSHHFWAFSDPASPRYRKDPSLSDAIDEVYGALDLALGRLMDAQAPSSSTLLVSDHGACGACDHAVYLNRWLADEGLVRFREWTRLSGRLARLARQAGARFVPAGFKQAVMRSPLADLVLATDGLARFGNLDLANCRAFSDELPQNPGIWIHQRGRDPRGIVEPGEAAERLRDRIAEGLLRWRQPHTGRFVVARVWRREEALGGPAFQRAPDLLLELARWDGYRLVAGSSDGRPGPSIRRLRPDELIGGKGLGTSGAHAPEGVLVAAGPRVKTGAGLGGARLEDLCPTAMVLLGLDVPTGLDGRPLSAVVGSPVPVRSSGTGAGGVHRRPANPEGEDAVRRRLEGLGYL